MVHLRHPNITSVLGACFEGRSPVLVMELMERGRRAQTPAAQTRPQVLPATGKPAAVREHASLLHVKAAAGRLTDALIAPAVAPLRTVRPRTVPHRPAPSHTVAHCPGARQRAALPVPLPLQRCARHLELLEGHNQTAAAGVSR